MMHVNRRAPASVRPRPLLAAIVTSAIALMTARPLQAQSAGEPQVLPTTRLAAGMYNINAMMATTPEQRSIGLMHRREMAANDGMLFVFEREGVQCFWMRNTLIPLAVAFIDDGGHIVNLDEMKPLSDESHCSSRPVRYVLEMNTGWFTKRGLKSGDRVSGPPFAKR